MTTAAQFGRLADGRRSGGPGFRGVLGLHLEPLDDLFDVFARQAGHQEADTFGTLGSDDERHISKAPDLRFLFNLKCLLSFFEAGFR